MKLIESTASKLFLRRDSQIGLSDKHELSARPLSVSKHQRVWLKLRLLWLIGMDICVLL
jgi:hypothetical protein